MKTLLILAIAALFALSATSVLADRGGRPNYRARPHAATATPTPVCPSDSSAATLSGSSINVTLARGESIERFVTYGNRTEGQQWVVASVEHYSNQTELRLPADWVTFDPAAACLEPGEWRRFDITIAVPCSAMRGEYFALLTWTPTNDGEPFGTAVGITARIVVQ